MTHQTTTNSRLVKCVPYKDPVKQKEYQDNYNKEHYSKNKARYLARNKSVCDRNVAWLNEYKKTLKYSKCGFSDYRALEFHHTIPVNNGSSNLRISSITRRNGWTTDRLKLYIEENFTVLCSNCHSIKHYEIRNNYQ
jgi:5-methylcytosine-specific restriction endonuclease McrA